MACVILDDVSFAYRLSRNRGGTLKEAMINMVRRQVEYEQLWALKNLSIGVSKGEVLGVIGPNGAGKSTLMRVIARVLPPTSGRVRVEGVVAPMIELGAGFNPELTGFENIVLYGSLLGRDPREMRDRAESIAVWAGVEGFLDVPLRSYSSGMQARLGFSVATDVKPDILLIDEVLSVGDQAFREKSLARVESLIAGDTAVVFVSHNMPTVCKISDRVIWLDQGAVVAAGEPKAVTEMYLNHGKES